MNPKSIIKNFDYVLSGCSLVVLVILTFVGVIRRYFFNAPITFLQEIQLFCAVWLVFWGGSVAVRTSGIVAIDFLVDLFSPKLQRVCTICIDVLCISVLAFLAVNGLRLLFFMAKTQRVSYVLGIPYSVIYLAFPLGCFLMGFWYVVKLTNLLRNKAEPGDEGKVL